MPLIEVRHATVIDTEKKEELIAELTKTYARVMDRNPSSVWVILQEVERANWGVGGKSLNNLDTAKED